MATPELQARAVELSERMLEGRRLLIKLGTLLMALEYPLMVCASRQ